MDLTRARLCRAVERGSGGMLVLSLLVGAGAGAGLGVVAFRYMILGVTFAFTGHRDYGASGHASNPLILRNFDTEWSDSSCSARSQPTRSGAPGGRVCGSGVDQVVGVLWSMSWTDVNQAVRLNAPSPTGGFDAEHKLRRPRHRL
jgi:hypothetical protein